MDELITIPKREYEMLRRQMFLVTAYEVAGVENWDGFDYAMELYRGYEDSDD